MGIFGDGSRAKPGSRRVAVRLPPGGELQVPCDRCHVAWAKVEVITDAGSVFLCGHHVNEHRSAIIAAGHRIWQA
jgi:hypothetical protein